MGVVGNCVSFAVRIDVTSPSFSTMAVMAETDIERDEYFFAFCFTAASVTLPRLPLRCCSERSPPIPPRAALDDPIKGLFEVEEEEEEEEEGAMTTPLSVVLLFPTNSDVTHNLVCSSRSSTFELFVVNPTTCRSGVATRMPARSDRAVSRFRNSSSTSSSSTADAVVAAATSPFSSSTMWRKSQSWSWIHRMIDKHISKGVAICTVEDCKTDFRVIPPPPPLLLRTSSSFSFPPRLDDTDVDDKARDVSFRDTTRSAPRKRVN